MSQYIHPSPLTCCSAPFLHVLFQTCHSDKHITFVEDWLTIGKSKVLLNVILVKTLWPAFMSLPFDYQIGSHIHWTLCCPQRRQWTVNAGIHQSLVSLTRANQTLIYGLRLCVINSNECVFMSILETLLFEKLPCAVHKHWQYLGQSRTESSCPFCLLV